jgi:hypothetical protein
MDFFAVIQSDAVAFFKSKFEEGFDIDGTFVAPDRAGIPAVLLHSPPWISIAAYFGSMNCLLYFRMLGADLNKPDSSELALKPIHFAIAGDQLESLNFFLCSGAATDGILYFAVHFDIIRALLTALRGGADDPNARFRGQTPIEKACEMNAVVAAEILLMNGAQFGPGLVARCRRENRDGFLKLLGNYDELRTEDA